MSILATLESPSKAEERRGSRRRALRLAAHGTTRSRLQTHVVIHDLSPDGLLIESSTAVFIGEHLEVLLPEEAAQATVVWSSGRYFGCQFKEPISQAAVSAALLFSPRPQKEASSDAVSQALSLTLLRRVRMFVSLAVAKLTASMRSRASTDHFIGWKLSREERNRLLQTFPPTYDRIIANHVTRISKPPAGTPAAPEVCAQVVGRAKDGSLECLVVEIDGTTVRPDGSTYHITWSLERGRKPVESNDVLRQREWQRIEQPVPIRLSPAR